MSFDGVGASAGPGHGTLEVIRQAPPGRRRQPVTLVFVHGAYAAAWCWGESFMPYFVKAGYPCVALSLRGHGNSLGRHTIDFAGIADYVEDLRQVLATVDGPAVIVGHSMGGFVAQKHLETGGTAAGMVLLASVPPFGLTASSLGLAFGNPMLLWRMSLLHGLGPSFGSRMAMREALFSHDITEADLENYFATFQPESSRAIMDMHGLDLVQASRVPRLPMLVLGAHKDALITETQVSATADMYGVAPVILPNLAHAVMLEPRWRLAADATRDWLDVTFGQASRRV